MSKILKIGVVLSVVWGMIATSLVMLVFGHQFGLVTIFGVIMAVGGLPLAVVWGVWWILKK